MVLFLLPFLLIQSISAAKLNESCTANSFCEIKNSYCSILAPTCGGGTCVCIPGFTDISGLCLKSVQLGQTCDSGSDTCHGDNAECNSKRCTCAQGYKQGLKGYDCVSNLKSERFSARCFDSVQCYYNMVCIENRCQCYPGFKQVGDYDCVERQVGDSCANDDDCSRAPNTACAGGVCSCISSFKRVQYYTDNHQTTFICIPASQTLAGEGDACNVTSVEAPVVCRSPFVCLSCSSSKTICTRPTVAYSQAGRLESFFSFLGLFVVSFVLFDC